MKEHPKDVIADQSQEAIMHVLEHHSDGDVKIEAVDPADALRQLGYGSGTDLETVSSSISVKGTELCCSLTLLASSETIMNLAPPMVTCPVDWSAELANLILGAMKNKLGAYGVNPVLGPPTAKLGPDLQFVTETGDQVIVSAVVTGGVVIVALTFEIVSEGMWTYDARLSAAEEGVVCLF